MNQYIEFFSSEVLNKRQKRNLIILLCVLFLSMVFETLGLGVLVPIINLALDFNASESIINRLNDFQIFLEPKNARKFVLIGSLILFTFKFISLNISIYLKSRFSYNLNAYISNKIYSIYINRGYTSHVKYNSGDLINTVQVEVPNLIAYVNSIISIITEFLLFLGVLILLLIVNFKATTYISLCLILFFVAYNKLTKSIFSNWGVIRNKFDSNLSSLILESISAFKYLKISKREDFFQKLYKRTHSNRAKIYIKYATLLEFPRGLIELVISFTIVIYFLVIFVQSGNNIEQLSLLALFMASAFKILPSLIRLNNSVQNIKFYKNSFKVINDVFQSEQLEKENIINSHFKTKLELINFSFKYGEDHIFKDSNFQINKGDIVGIIGESGSGKSTFIDLICGLIPFNSVDLKTDNSQIIHKDKSLSFFSKIGYVTQFIYLLDSSIKKNIAFGIDEDQIDDKKIEELIKTVGLDDFISSKKDGINSMVGNDGITLSGGQKQRIGIARALYNSPDFLVLDESTSALDIKTENKILDSISSLKSKTTVLLSTHRINNLEICDYVYQIKNSKITKINLTDI